MPITILDTILDEEIRTPATQTADEHDVASLSAGVQTAIEAVTDPGDFITSPTGFPQFAAKTNFASSDNPVTDYFLGDSAGDPLDGVATDLFVGSNKIFLYSLGDNIVVGRVGNGTTADPAGEVALVIALNETVENGFVTGADLWLALYAPLIHDGEDLVDSADQLDLTDLIYLGSDFDTTEEVPFTDFSDVPSGNPDFNVIFPTGVTADVQLLTTGSEGGEQSTVNISTAGIGAGAQHVENGATLRIDTVSGMIQDNVDDNSELVPSAIEYASHVNIVAGEFEITQVNPASPNSRADLTLFVFQVDDDEPQGQAYLDDANSDDGAPVEIDVADVRIFLGAVDVTATFGGTITQNGDGVTITGLDDDHIVKFTTDGEEFDRILITNVDTKQTFDIGNIKVTALQGGSDTEIEELGSHLIFQDDGPTIAASGATAPSMLVDESDLTADDSDDYSGLFDLPDYGADGEGSLGYTLGVSEAGADSGLTDTATGNSVFLFLESGVVIGREGTDATDAETGDEVFRVTVNSSGNVTLNQSRAVVHDDENDPDDSTGLASAGLITLTATVHDSEAADENDSDSATVDIGDTFLFKDDGPTIDESSGEDLLVTNGLTPGDSDSGDFDLDAENDQEANVTIVGAPDTNGFTFSFDNGDNDSITGQLNGEDLYTLVVDDDGGYVFTLIGELAPTEDQLNVNEIKAGGPNTNFIEVGTTLTSDYVKLSGFDASDNPAAINESNANVGVKNGNLDNGESIKFELFDENDAPITFLGLNIGTKSAKVSEYLVDIDFVDPNVADITDLLVLVGKNGTLMIDPDGDDLIQSITIEKLSGSAIKLGLADIEILRPPGDFQLGFDLQLTDGDDDFVGASFIVEIDGNANGSITDPFIV